MKLENEYSALVIHCLLYDALPLSIAVSFN